MPARLYLLGLKSGAFYVGAATDLDQRYKDHCSGKASRTTRLDPPVGVAYRDNSQPSRMLGNERCKSSAGHVPGDSYLRNGMEFRGIYYENRICDF